MRIEVPSFVHFYFLVDMETVVQRLHTSKDVVSKLLSCLAKKAKNPAKKNVFPAATSMNAMFISEFTFSNFLSIAVRSAQMVSIVDFPFEKPHCETLEP